MSTEKTKLEVQQEQLDMEEDKNMQQNLDNGNCPECGCDYTYEVGYGFRECFECLNTWKDN